MDALTLDQLRGIMRDCIGADEEVDLDGDIADRQFTELGYDSLAVLELFTRVEDAYRVRIPDEASETIGTPADLLDYVNQKRVEAGA
jgi:act minimal PKS acyl carrier protein